MVPVVDGGGGGIEFRGGASGVLSNMKSSGPRDCLPSAVRGRGRMVGDPMLSSWRTEPEMESRFSPDVLGLS